MRDGVEWAETPSSPVEDDDLLELGRRSDTKAWGRSIASWRRRRPRLAAATVVAVSSAALQPPREPKYYTVKRHLLAVIESLEPDSAVPTERVLSAELGTSRTTVRQALLELVAEGRLVRRQGSGTYVAEPKMTWPLHLTSFTEQAAANGFTASTQLISAARIRADEDVAQRLAVVVGAPVFRMERLRLADERPMAVETAHLSAARFPQLTRHLRRAQSLYGVLAAVYGVVPVTAEESIATAPASPREAALLHTDTGAPMVVLGRQTFDASGRLWSG